MLPQIGPESFAAALAESGDRQIRRLLALEVASWRPGSLELPGRTNGYTRTCVFRNDAFELVLINWDIGSSSSIHDHGGQRCWLAVLEGALRVDDYVRRDGGRIPNVAILDYLDSFDLSAGDVDARSGRFDIHRVSCAGRTGAVSLHLYARPIRTFGVYDPERSRCTSEIASYDATLPLTVEVR